MSSSTSQGVTMEPFRMKILKLRENARLGRLHSIAFEFARGRGYPNPIPNPVALSSKAGQQFMKGLDALEYDTLDELLSHPSHYIVGFHGTGSVDAIPSIFSENFDPSRRSGQHFGPGEYFDIEKGSIATQFSKGMDCLIVALIVIKDKSGQDLPEVRTPTYHSSKERIAVVGNPVNKAYALNLPLAVASAYEVSEGVKNRLGEVFADEFRGIDRLDIVGSHDDGSSGSPKSSAASVVGEPSSSPSLAKKATDHYLFTPHSAGPGNGNYNLRIRGGPSFQDPVLGGIPPGSVVDVFGGQGDWLQVHFGGVIGWSAKELDNATILQKVRTYRFTPHRGGPGNGNYNLRIRAGPSFQDQVLGHIPPSSIVYVLNGKNNGSSAAVPAGWLEVSFGGIRGWSAQSLDGVVILSPH